MRGGLFGMKKIRTNEELVNEANRPTSGCANGSTSDHACWASAYLYIENHRGLLVFSDKEVRLLLKHGQLLIKGQSFVIKTIPSGRTFA